MRRRRMSRRALLGVILAAPISACISAGSQHSATTTPAVQRTIALPTTPPTSTPTAIERTTRAPETTLAPSPSATSAPRASAIPSPSPTPTQVPYRSPLTGLSSQEPPGRPFAVQIDNSPEARPQSGLYRADIVYETPTEAGVTRYTAFFESDLPPKIGPVRSVRVAALEVIPTHDGILVYSGASIDMTQALFESGIPAIHAEGNGIRASRRDPDRQAPHNLYVSGPELREVAEELGIDGVNRSRPLSFGERPSGGRRTSGVTVRFPNGTVNWVYNETEDVFLRELNGEPHVDFERPDRQVKADNVAILRAPFEWMDFVDDAAGELTFGVELTGEGEALILRQGLYYEGRWTRENDDDPIRMFLGSSGAEITLKTGRTWFAILADSIGDPDIIPPNR